MARKKKKATKQRSKRLWLVVGVVVVALGLWIGLSLCRARTYAAERILLAPDILFAPETQALVSGGERSWALSRVELIRQDRVVRVPPLAYKRFYQRLEGERSLRKPLDELEEHFQQPGVTRLRLVMKPCGLCAAAISQEEVQLVELSPTGGLVRIQLIDRSGEWAYFRVQGIERQLVRSCS